MGATISRRLGTASIISPSGVKNTPGTSSPSDRRRHVRQQQQAEADQQQARPQLGGRRGLGRAVLRGFGAHLVAPIRVRPRAKRLQRWDWSSSPHLQRGGSPFSQQTTTSIPDSPKTPAMQAADAVLGGKSRASREDTGTQYPSPLLCGICGVGLVSTKPSQVRPLSPLAGRG